jgi:large subunit ribosomal protein L18
MRLSKLPRLTVFRSNRYIYAQVIDDNRGVTLAASSGKEPAEAGALIAQNANANKITNVVFDRGPYKFHGRVKALAEGARRSGLKF